MTGRKRFFRNGILLSVAGLAVRTVGMLTSAFVSGTVGAEGIGLFSLVMTVFGFAVTFATSGISLTVTRLVAGAIGEKNPSGVTGVLRAAFLYAGTFSAVATAVLLLLADPIALGTLGDGRAALPLRVLALSLMPTAFSGVIAGYFVAVRRVARNAVGQVASQLLRVGLLIFCLSEHTASATGACTFLAWCAVAAEVLSFLILFVRFLADRRGAEGKSGGCIAMREVSSMAIPLAVSAYIRSALLTLEHVLIPICLGWAGQTHAAALAAYGVLHGMAIPMILYPMAPLTSFSGLLVPEFSECLSSGQRERMKHIAEEAVDRTLVFAVGVSVLLGLFSEEIGWTVYHSAEAGHYIAVLAPIIPVMYLDHVTDSMLKGIGEHVYSMWVNISDSVLSVLLVILLLPRLGIIGYAVVIIGMEAYNFALSFSRLEKRVGFPVHPVRSLACPALAALFGLILTRRLFLPLGSDATGIMLAVKATFAACLFLAFTLLLRTLPNMKKWRNANKYKKNPG